MPIWEILLESIGWKEKELTDLARHRLIRRMIGTYVTDLVTATDQRLRDSGVKSVEDLQRLDYNVIGLSQDMQRRNRELKDFLYNNLYRYYRVVRMAVKAERIIRDLFDAYMNEPAILPAHAQVLFDDRGLERSVCDYIAGMTDRFAIEEHEKIFSAVTLP